MPVYGVGVHFNKKCCMGLEKGVAFSKNSITLVLWLCLVLPQYHMEVKCRTQLMDKSSALSWKETHTPYYYYFKRWDAELYIRIGHWSIVPENPISCLCAWRTTLMEKGIKKNSNLYAWAFIYTGNTRNTGPFSPNTFLGPFSNTVDKIKHKKKAKDQIWKVEKKRTNKIRMDTKKIVGNKWW